MNERPAQGGAFGDAAGSARGLVDSGLSGTGWRADEIRTLLDQYDIGKPKRVRPWVAGNPRQPKLLVETGSGAYLLKRRAPELSAEAVAYSQRVHLRLAAQGVPTPRLIGTREGNNTLVRFDAGDGECVYEMFAFVRAEAYRPTVGAAGAAGGTLAKLHTALWGFEGGDRPNAVEPDDPGRALSICAERFSERVGLVRGLMGVWETARERLARHGTDAGMIHGDWHPGNTLWRGDELIAAIDFDAVREGDRLVDLAGGAMHFAIARRGEDARGWATRPDAGLLGAFWAGYERHGQSRAGATRAAPWAMIRTLLQEAAVPLARTGRLGTIGGDELLGYLAAVCGWLHDHAEGVSAVLERGEGG